MDTSTIISYKTQNFEYSRLRTEKGNQTHIETAEHSAYELFFFVRGNVIYFINDKQFLLTPYDVLCINRFEAHAPHILPSEEYERIYIHFDQEFIRDYYSFVNPLMQLFTQSPHRRIPHLRLNKVSLRQVFSLLEDMEKLIAAKDDHGVLQLFLQLLFVLNVAHLDALTAPNNSSSKSEKLFDVLDWIDAHYTENINLDDLSKSFFINKYYLCHIFKDYTGFSPISYINFKRVTQAIELMSQNVSLTDCCYRVGFNNYSVFYKSFIKFLGCSPREYINLNF